jgi:hypothetical protein
MIRIEERERLPPKRRVKIESTEDLRDLIRYEALRSDNPQIFHNKLAALTGIKLSNFMGKRYSGREYTLSHIWEMAHIAFVLGYEIQLVRRSDVPEDHKLVFGHTDRKPLSLTQDPVEIMRNQKRKKILKTKKSTGDEL